MASTYYTLRGVITLTSPTHQTALDREGNHAPQISTNVASDQGVIRVPIVTANSVRALLRRHAAQQVMDSLARRKQQIPRDVYLSTTRGSYSRTGMRVGDATLAEISAARGHVFSGLFGGGARMHPSILRMELDLMPMVAETSDMLPERWRAYCRGEALRRNAEGRIIGSALTESLLLTGRDDLAAGRGAEVIENYPEAYREYMARVNSAGTAKRAQRAAVQQARDQGQRMVVADSDRAKAESLATFATFEAIVPGTRLYFGLRLANPTPAQLGLALLAVRDWGNANALGGGASRGRGAFKALLELCRGNEVLAESLLMGDAPCYTLADTPAVSEAVASATAEIDAITPASLALAYPVVTESAALESEEA